MASTDILNFLIVPFSKYKIDFSKDGTKAIIFNPFGNENIEVEYYNTNKKTPFIVRFSFQHRHLDSEKDVLDYIKEIIDGKIVAIEFFKDGKKSFGGDIETEKLADMSYEKLEQLTGFCGATKLYHVADSFKARGWNESNSFDAVLPNDSCGKIIIR